MVNRPISNSLLLSAIKAHATANYNSGGWDYLVECYTDNDILLLTAECMTIADAIAKLGRIMSIMDERRREIQSEAF
jgi:hypothetical protein